MVLSDTAIDLAGTFPSNVLIVYAWTRMLRMRSPALFFVVLLALIAVVVLGRTPGVRRHRVRRGALRFLVG